MILKGRKKLNSSKEAHNLDKLSLRVKITCTSKMAIILFLGINVRDRNVLGQNVHC